MPVSVVKLFKNSLMVACVKNEKASSNRRKGEMRSTGKGKGDLWSVDLLC